ncbi:hypothetical protein OVY01_02890 [Robbsia sp. Bb-Pol-6]|uniref:Nucleoside-specific outer membrane channel protein Tsx n=1 Tax=Robbsia betulipollinis TaxID=2981849 RepID=A0ABT3ZI61_9BURK|nr:hypothetical protein [Robbsia betulipollinis]MCY0386209.1 hypothetical protein [Robbsia betulipollinis]
MKEKSSVVLKHIFGMAALCCLIEPVYADEVIPPVLAVTPTTPATPTSPATSTSATNPAPTPTPAPTPDKTDLGKITGGDARPAVWNDTYVGFRYGTDFHFPGVPDKVALRIGYLTTVGSFKYGGYAFTVDYLVSNAANPEAGTSHASATGGAQEVYSVGRVEWSGEKIFGHSLRFGFIRDIGFTTGYEFGTKNDAYAEAARMLVFGPTVEFAVPQGYWNFTAGVRTESNHNGITNTDVKFHAAWHLESSWMIPLQAGPVPLVFKGFATMTGPKGKDGFGINTTTEFLTRVSLLADVGALARRPRVLYVGVGYEYWHNMYGTPTSETVNTRTSAPMVMAEIHF